MKRILVFEFKRAAQSKEFFISIFIGCLLVMLDLLLFYGRYKEELMLHNALEAWLGTDFQFAYNTIFYVLFPILAALPFAGSYYRDIKSGYIKNLCVKVSRKSYYWAKYITVYVFSAVAVMLPLALSLFLTMGILPMRRPDRLLFITAGIIDRNLMAGIFGKYPLLYCLIYIGIDGMFAGMLSVFCICIAERVESLFSALAVPFAIYVLLGVVLSGGEMHTWSLMQMMNPLQIYVFYGWQLGIYFSGGIVITAVWIWLKGRKKDIL